MYAAYSMRNVRQRMQAVVSRNQQVDQSGYSYHHAGVSPNTKRQVLMKTSMSPAAAGWAMTANDKTTNRWMAAHGTVCCPMQGYTRESTA